MTSRWSMWFGGVLLCLMSVAYPSLANSLTNGSLVRVVCDLDSPQQAFGIERLSRSLLQGMLEPAVVDRSKATGREYISVNVQGSAMNPMLQKEGFSLSRNADGIQVNAIDESGAMYGLLELAELIQIHGLEKVPEKTVNPRFPFRAIKFNLPWSSYRRHESLQLHAETVRDLKFWESYLDMMAENRFNTLSLWALHNFPYMVRPKNYPLACPFDDAELKEWQTFWHTLFKMAKDRGIETYLVNWNVFGSEGFVKNYSPESNPDGAKYFVDAHNTPVMEAYTKEVVTQVINEYPNLTGLGISLGEGMHEMSAVEREEWIQRTFVAGMDAADRKIKFIHRVPFTAKAGNGGSTDRATEEMTRNAIEAIDSIGPVWVEIKFNWSHGHSTPKLVQVHGGSISDAYWNPLPKDYAITWMIRNEDFFVLRWGEPDFIRQHIAMNGPSYVGGYFIGSECYIPAKEYIHVPGHEHINWTYSWERQWLYYKEWGRLLFDPETPDTIFAMEFDQRFGKGVGSKMVEAYKLASRMPLRFASFFFSGWDFTMYSEGFMMPSPAGGGKNDKKSPFVSVEEMLDHKVLDPDYLSIKDYVTAAQNSSVSDERITPLQLADEMQESGEKALAIVASITSTNETLECEMMDIQAWSYQSLYFAEKLRAAVALETYRVTGNLKQKTEAVALLEKAKEQWLNLVAVTAPHQQAIPAIQVRNATFSWANLIEEVERDITVAEQYNPQK